MDSFADRLAESLMSIKLLTLSDLNLSTYDTTSDVKPDSECTNLFGRRFRDLNYKYIVYLVHDNYMNNVDRFILEKKGENNLFNFNTIKFLSNLIKYIL